MGDPLPMVPLSDLLPLVDTETDRLPVALVVRVLVLVRVRLPSGCISRRSSSRVAITPLNDWLLDGDAELVLVTVELTLDEQLSEALQLADGDELGLSNGDGDGLQLQEWLEVQVGVTVRLRGSHST